MQIPGLVKLGYQYNLELLLTASYIILIQTLYSNEYYAGVLIKHLQVVPKIHDCSETAECIAKLFRPKSISMIRRFI